MASRQLSEGRRALDVGSVKELWGAKHGLRAADPTSEPDRAEDESGGDTLTKLTGAMPCPVKLLRAWDPHSQCK
eukprot:3446255-Rhodomonas_salina.2